MVMFGGGSSGTVVKLRCPHCGTVQVRARVRASERYVCKSCGKEFTREEGRLLPPAAKKR